MSTIKDTRVEALADIFQEYGISATPDQIEKIESDFSHHLDCEREFSYTPSTHREECTKCRSMEQQLKESQKEVEVYRNSVKQRRNADRVWLDGESVMYE